MSGLTSPSMWTSSSTFPSSVGALWSASVSAGASESTSRARAPSFRMASAAWAARRDAVECPAEDENLLPDLLQEPRWLVIVVVHGRGQRDTKEGYTATFPACRRRRGPGRLGRGWRDGHRGGIAATSVQTVLAQAIAKGIASQSQARRGPRDIAVGRRERLEKAVALGYRRGVGGARLACVGVSTAVRGSRQTEDVSRHGRSLREL